MAIQGPGVIASIFFLKVASIQMPIRSWLPNGVGVIRIEIGQIAELINLRSNVGVWAAIAVTYISGLR